MTLKLRSILLASAILLAACSLPAQQTLNERLKGKAADEKQEILRLECLNEAEYSTIKYKNETRPHIQANRMIYLADTKETSNFKKLCRKMTDNFGAKNALSKKLADECTIQITNVPKNTANMSHIERMKDICEKMTGESVISTVPEKEIE